MLANCQIADCEYLLVPPSPNLHLPENHALQARYITFFSCNFEVAVYYPRDHLVLL